MTTEKEQKGKRVSDLKDVTFKDREKMFGPIEADNHYLMQLVHDGTRRIVLVDVFIDSDGDWLDSDGDEIDTNNWSALSWTKGNV